MCSEKIHVVYMLLDPGCPIPSASNIHVPHTCPSSSVCDKFLCEGFLFGVHNTYSAWWMGLCKDGTGSAPTVVGKGSLTLQISRAFPYGRFGALGLDSSQFGVGVRWVQKSWRVPNTLSIISTLM